MLLYFFHCTDKGKLLVKLKTIMSDLLHLTEKERLLILYCTDKRGLFMKIRCYYTASRGIGKAISKTMPSYLRYRTEKGRQLVKPCCYMSCIVRTKGKLKPCLFVPYRTYKGRQSPKPCYYIYFIITYQGNAIIKPWCYIYYTVQTRANY